MQKLQFDIPIPTLILAEESVNKTHDYKTRKLVFRIHHTDTHGRSASFMLLPSVFMFVSCILRLVVTDPQNNL